MYIIGLILSFRLRGRVVLRMLDNLLGNEAKYYWMYAIPSIYIWRVGSICLTLKLLNSINSIIPNSIWWSINFAVIKWYKIVGYFERHYE